MLKEIILLIGLIALVFTSSQGVDAAVTATLNEVVLGQPLVNVDCEGFKNINNAQSIFVQAVEQVLGDFSTNGIKAAVQPGGVTCANGDVNNISSSEIKLMKVSSRLILTTNQNELKTSPTSLQNALPSIQIEYLLSWVVPSTDILLLNSIYVLVTTALANAISSAEFNTILQTIAQRNNVTILFSATSPSLTNLTSLKISILDLSTSPSSIPNINTRSDISGNDIDMAVEVVIGIILAALFAAVCLTLLVWYRIYRKEIKCSSQNSMDCDLELASTNPSFKHQFDINVYDCINCHGINHDYEQSTICSTRSSEIHRMQIGRFSHFIGFGKGFEGRLSQYDDRKSYNKSRLTMTPSTRSNSSGRMSFNRNRDSHKGYEPILIPDFNWSDIELKGTTLAEAVIGKGSFGSVVLARLNAKNEEEQLITTDDVVIKVMTKSMNMSRDVNVYEKNLNMAIQEVSVLMDAESKIVYKDCIIKVYGIASGPLSQQLCEILNVSEDAAVVGIVMRLENGGSLNTFIHSIPPPPPSSSSSSSSLLSHSHLKLDMKDKLRLLTGIARGIAELHTAGIVHGDIKPDNILLSSKDFTTAEIRLADFGLATVREQNSLLDSSLSETAHFRGTPLYSAPEMLIDPYAEIVNDKVARPSRKTDIYAFAILAWEVLTEQKPFHDIKNESVLGMKVHQGYRPSPSALPDNVPNKIKNLIIACWDSSRSIRLSAIECYSIFKHYHGLMVNATYDVYLTCHPNQQTIVNFIFNRMSQNGLNVSLINKPTTTNNHIITSPNTTTTTSSTIATITTTTASDHSTEMSSMDQYQEQNILYGVSKAKIIVACVTVAFQQDHSCLAEVREARKLKKNVIPLFIQSDVHEWINGDIDYACQMKDAATVTFNASKEVGDESWMSEDGPSQFAIQTLNQVIDKLCDHLSTQIKIEHF